jgi:hypothetical protein
MLAGYRGRRPVPQVPSTGRANAPDYAGRKSAGDKNVVTGRLGYIRVRLVVLRDRCDLCIFERRTQAEAPALRQSPWPSHHGVLPAPRRSRLPNTDATVRTRSRTSRTPVAMVVATNGMCLAYWSVSCHFLC